MNFHFKMKLENKLKINSITKEKLNPISELYDHVRKYTNENFILYYQQSNTKQEQILENSNLLLAQKFQINTDNYIIVEQYKKMNCSQIDIELYIEDNFIQQISEDKNTTFYKLIENIKSQLGETSKNYFPYLYNKNKNIIPNFSINEKIQNYIKYGEPLILRLLCSKINPQNDSIFNNNTQFIIQSLQKISIKNFILQFDLNNQRVEYYSTSQPKINGAFCKLKSTKKITQQELTSLQWKYCGNIQYAELEDIGFALLWNNDNISSLKVKQF